MCNLKYGLKGIGALGFHRDKNLAGMYELARTIKAFGAAAVVQLSLGLGREPSPELDPFGPSAVAVELAPGSMPKGLKLFEGFTSPPPKPLTVEEIEELVNLFIASALRIQNAGFDGIEIHGAHGYALAGFLSPHANQRTDKYGGSFEKRMTLALDLIRKTRQAVGDDFILGFRISGDEHITGGRTLAETKKNGRHI